MKWFHVKSANCPLYFLSDLIDDRQKNLPTTEFKLLVRYEYDTRVMVYKGHREMSILVAPLFLPKKPYWWPQGGPYFKTSPY